MATKLHSDSDVAEDLHARHPEPETQPKMGSAYNVDK